MNLIDRLRHLSEKLSYSDRQTGRTTLLAKAAKNLNGVLLCHDFEFAKAVGHEHDVVTKSTEVNLHGLMGPFFIDHHAVANLFDRAASELAAKEFTLTCVKSNLSGAENTIKELEKKLIEEVKTNAGLRGIMANQQNQIDDLRLVKALNMDQIAELKYYKESALSLIENLKALLEKGIK